MQEERQKTLFSYSSARQFLLDTLSERQSTDKSFSVRAWAREMELNTHTLLVMLLQGTRPIRLKHAAFLAKGLGLGAQEKLYFQALIQFENAEDMESKEMCSLWMSELNPGNHFTSREVDEFQVISHWMHMAILSMLHLKDFGPDPREIAKRLKGKVTANEVRAALERLSGLGFIKKDNHGKLRATFARVSTSDDLKNEGARRYHAQVLDLAKDAIMNIPLEQREFQSFTLAVPKNKMKLAKEMIRRFRGQFAQAVGRSGADEVCQMNIQFFQLTESPSARTERTVEDEGADTEMDKKTITH
ncbi:MAG: hypothetical protein A2583_06695 [Bdellovibrionales bacterium RIFOXYD1_FULL_53_11]|nr:MAG: hypothetical protein A2583_06695 [Bdellovibrionales bacterium RIFOXYD1_FULL_53_11]